VHDDEPPALRFKTANFRKMGRILAISNTRDQFWAHSARVEAIQHAAAQPAENGNQGEQR